LLSVSAYSDTLKTQIDEVVRPLLEWKPKCALVIGIVENGNQHIFSYGQLSLESPKKPDGDTVFEIGSITKVFTAILLSDMVLKGELKLDDPIKKHLPDSVTMPAWKARDITLHDLARHTSGLPRITSNMKPSDPENPYADYTVEQLYEFLNQVEYEFEPGTKSVYSNIGAGLLGYILGRIDKSDYETLLSLRLCKPLGMKDTVITFNADLRSRLAQGYKYDDTPSKNWDAPDAYAGAGAIRSTIDDMMKFLSANMEIIETSLTPAMKFSHQAHLPKEKIVAENMRLGWHVPTIGDGKIPIIFHNGQTGGYHGFLGFNQEKKMGTVALINYGVMQLDNVGFNVLRVLAGLEMKDINIPKERTEISIDPSVLDAYIGQYEFSPDYILTITKENDCLYVQAKGQGKHRAFPESKTKFFLKIVDAQISFHKNDRGEVTHLVLHQDGDQKATKIK